MNFFLIFALKLINSLLIKKILYIYYARFISIKYIENFSFRELKK